MNIERKFAPILERLANRFVNWRPEFFDKTQERRNWWCNRMFDVRWRIGRIWIEERLISALAAMQSVFKTRQLPSFEPNNPFWHDHSRQGHYLGSKNEICVMWGASEGIDEVVIFHQDSGQRIAVQFPKRKTTIVIDGWLIDRDLWDRFEREDSAGMRTYEYIDARDEFLQKWGSKK
jgi:hypothetical protein